ncbi:MAG: rhamnogalacturonan lyase [Polyangiales bacterium]
MLLSVALGAAGCDAPDEARHDFDVPHAEAVEAPATAPTGFYRLEQLDRGLVAVAQPGGVYVGWRLLGHEWDDAQAGKLAFQVLRNGAPVATVTNSTNYVDAGGSASARYQVRAVLGEQVLSTSAEITPWGQNFVRIPLTPPPAGSTPAKCQNANERYTYVANDGSVGDLDGDGQYEVILKWDPSNSKDNSQAGCTGNVYLDAYKLDGTRLWRIDLGRNIRAGAHYTQFVVYDFDGDGKSEMAVKTAPGARDGKNQFLKLGPAAGDNDSADHRNATGYVLAGPEYLTVYGGVDGAELDTVAWDVPRGNVNAWGDDYGNRVDRFLASAAFLDDSGLASIVMARGYYTRATLTAWNFRGGKLSKLWKFDSNNTPRDARGKPYAGQGAHWFSVANVDADPGQEILYGAAAIDHDGRGLCSTGFGHGDALHVSDLVPERPGLEVFMPNEDGKAPSWHLRDARTCEVIAQGPVNGKDTGRAVAADVLPSSPGAELWAASTSGVVNTRGARVGNPAASTNFVIWWDADDARELEDANNITKYGGGVLLRCDACAGNNGTKNTPTLTADLLGDWREEVIWRESNNTGLRIYTTTAPTTRKLYTLMHDAQYRMQVSGQQAAYNQPPHPSFTPARAPKPNLRY